MKTKGLVETRGLNFLKRKGGKFMANPKFDHDPIILALRESHPKSGPDPEPGEDINHWAERYMEYVRQKYGLKE